MVDLVLVLLVLEIKAVVVVVLALLVDVGGGAVVGGLGGCETGTVLGVV